jgi:hypothetical protein
VLDSRPFFWLPMGRSLFQNKRIPRENLNSLVVDEAWGPAGARGMVTWHLVGGAEAGVHRFHLGESSGSVEVLLLPLGGDSQVKVLGCTTDLSGLNVAHLCM